MRARLPSGDVVAGEGLETQIRRVRIGDGHILVTRLMSGEVVAFAPVCPHQFTELDEATIRDGQLRCPRHGYLYDTRTGENIHPGRETLPENRWKVRPGYLPCFPVQEEDGWITVSDDVMAPPSSFDPSLEQRRALQEPDSVDEPAPPAPAADAVVAVEQSVKFLTVSSGTTVDIRLPLIPRPGFGWSFEVTGHLLEVVEEQFEPGHSPCQLIRVDAHGAGAATLTCTYATQAGVRAEVRTFIVRVQA